MWWTVNYNISYTKVDEYNGKKYPMYGVTRHQDRLGKGSALSNADHDRDLSYIKEVGATTVRFAHYQQSEYLYSRCDAGISSSKFHHNSCFQSGNNWKIV